MNGKIEIRLALINVAGFLAPTRILRDGALQTFKDDLLIATAAKRMPYHGKRLFSVGLLLAGSGP